MHAWRVASVAASRGVAPLSIDGRRVRFLGTVLASLMFTVHLFGAHVSHGGDIFQQPTNEHDAGLVAPLVAATGAGTSMPVGADGVDADQAHAESTHHDPTCGEAAPSRDSLPFGAMFPVRRVLWHLEPLACTYSPPTGPEPPRRSPSPVHELGVQRV